MSGLVADTIYPLSPLSPDFHYCHARFGQDLKATACSRAWDKMADVITPRLYSIHGNHGEDWALPWISVVDGCAITIEVAGPYDPIGTAYYVLAPDAIRRTTKWVMNQCVDIEGGLGGYFTVDFTKMVRYIAPLKTDAPAISYYIFPATTMFLTVSITGEGGLLQPGNYDPMIPLALWYSRGSNGHPPPFRDPFFLTYAEMSRTLSQHLPNPETWWNVLRAPNKPDGDAELIELLGHNIGL